MDDGSTDETAALVRSLALPAVQLLSTSGVGKAAARNAGLRRADGAWLAFLDADDYWHPELLSAALARIAEAEDAVACFVEATPVDDDGRPAGAHPIEPEISLEDLLFQRVLPTTSATLAHRETVLACGGFFERLDYAQDLDLWIRLARRGRCLGVSRPLATYVVQDRRDRARSRELLRRLESDRELVVDRLPREGIDRRNVRRARAVMRARTARYWLRAGYAREGRRAAIGALRVRPTVEGLVTLLASAVPNSLREQGRALRRNWRAKHLGGTR